jgi:hypothetical protein
MYFSASTSVVRKTLILDAKCDFYYLAYKCYKYGGVLNVKPLKVEKR